MRWARSSSIRELLSILSSISTERLVDEREFMIRCLGLLRRRTALHRDAAADVDKAMIGKPGAEFRRQVGIDADERPFMLREHELHQVLGLLAAFCDDRPNDEPAAEGAQ